MLTDGARFEEAVQGGSRIRAIGSFVQYLERKLGFTALYDRRRVPFGRFDLVELFRIAQKLLDGGIIENYQFLASWRLPDEPPIRVWSCRIADPAHSASGGASSEDDGAALAAALAEGLERYLWWTERDYFLRPILATSKETGSRFPYLAPERFAGYSAEQRKSDPRLFLDPDAKYLWIVGTSLVSGKRTYVPAQQASAAHSPRNTTPKEPLIRTQITNGLATWPTKQGAQLRGALECIERDAYMVMWFNQLTLPRADLSLLQKRSPSLEKLVARCEKYGLRVHVLPMLTDAPTHAICVIVEDPSAIGLRFTLGLKASASLAKAAEGALIEALRARRFTRLDEAAKHYDASQPVDSIGHRGRVYYYWLEPKNAQHIEFLIAGKEKDVPEAAWEHDSDEKHLERITAWCREKGYEFVSVSMGHSKANPTRWHVEMAIMPELQWTHLTEKSMHLGGERLQSVPKQFGYVPRKTPFTERPHPYS